MSLALSSAVVHTHVATLILAAGAPDLAPAQIRGVSVLLNEAAQPDWLEAGRAVDLAFSPPQNIDVRLCATEIRQALAPLPIDVVVQRCDYRRKKLFLADMDSTMIGQECIDELADLIGLKAHVSAITERAMQGEIAFEPALRERVALLKDIEARVIERVLAERIRLTPGGRPLVRTMQEQGAYTCLVSGGFTLFTGPISERIGFDEHRANVLLMQNGRLTGKVAEPILGKEAKLATLRELRAKLNLAPEETLAVGDGANDLAMLEEAGLGVAFHAKPRVAAAAHARIDHGDLTTLLFVQGYRSRDFRAQ